MFCRECEAPILLKKTPFFDIIFCSQVLTNILREIGFFLFLF